MTALTTARPADRYNGASSASAANAAPIPGPMVSPTPIAALTSATPAVRSARLVRSAT